MVALKWGIVGTGKICHDFVVALHTLNIQDHLVKAVAGRCYKKAEEFGKSHSIQEYFDDFEYLAKHEDIDVIYIGVVNTEHFRLAKLMLENSKNVLVEKPMCMNLEETNELIKIARDNKRFLMEAIWSRCFPVYKEIQQQISSGLIGEVLQVNANLGFPLTHVLRVTSRELGGGSMLDLGVYVLQFAQFIFPGLKPEQISSIGNLNEEGIDENVGILIKFLGGKQAVLSVNTKVSMSNTAEIMGEKGHITVPNFWCPNSVDGPQGRKEFPLPKTKEYLNFINSTGLSYQIDEVRRCIFKGWMESPQVTLEDSKDLARWRDVIHKQIGRRNND